MRREVKTGFRSAGTFCIGQKLIYGEITLDGRNTSLFLRDEEHFFVEESDNLTIHGELYDFSKISLIGCGIKTTCGTYSSADKAYSYSEIFPHFVMIGDQHICPDDEVISGVSFSVDNGHALFFDLGVFGAIHDFDEATRVIEHHSSTITVGEFPSVFYYTGKREILNVETCFGTFYACHSPTHRATGQNGVRIDNRIVVGLDFPSGITFQESIDRIVRVNLFLELISGRQQSIDDFTICAGKNSEGHENFLSVYWSLPWARKENNIDRPLHVADPLLCGGRNTQEFSKTLCAWLDRHHSWGAARMRCRNAFTDGSFFSPDRIVAAANMFDIVPEYKIASAEYLSKDILEARDQARQIFLALPSSLERDSILGALGRLGAPSLKRKVRSRSEIIIQATGGRFNTLHIVTDEAINCRNFFVHGTRSRIDYGDDFLRTVPFLTSALEFVFIASDLIDAGWDVNRWLSAGGTLSHPMAAFVYNYRQNLQDLQKRLQ